MGLHFLDIVGHKDHERVIGNFKKVMRGEEIPPYELKYHTGHGKALVVEPQLSEKTQLEEYRLDKKPMSITSP
jgi:hypothetical protein